MLERLDLKSLGKERAIYLVGIGGAGMSAIATVLLQMGYIVEGSDIKESPNVRRLRKMGVDVGIGHRAANVGSASVVVRSSAISQDNPELLEAERTGIPVIDRAKMLAAIMETRKGIAIAGTHGKTTTSSLVTQMLLGCGADPSFLIGGELNETGGNAHYGGGEYLVAEADESDGSLINLRPEAVILTNVDGDHLDYFENAEQAASLFLEFLLLIPDNGFAVICGDDPRARRAGLQFEKAGGRLHLYGGGQDNQYRFRDQSIRGDGSTYTALCGGDELGQVDIRIPGTHNIYNSLAAIAMGHQLGMSVEKVLNGIGEFKGVRRRFETIGIRAGIKVIDDYAHHPTEITAVLDLAGSIAPSRVVAVFQPHRYSRTEILASEFGQCFSDADIIIVTDVYGAGEEPIPGVTGKLIVESILQNDSMKPVIYVPNRADLAREVVGKLKQDDYVLTIGAGDITQCAGEILELLGE